MMPDEMPAAAATAGVAVGDMPAVATPVVATSDAKRVAGTILEVLAGVRSITDAAVALGVTAARYYALEARAVAGLIAACEPRSPGPVPGSALAGELDRLRAERDRLREEAARYQALARIAQTAFGPPGSPTSPAAVRLAPPPVVQRRKKRVPTVRALRLAQQVQQSATSPVGTPPTTPPAAAGG